MTGAINTGHGSTTSAQVGSGTTNKTCRWTTFPAVAGTVVTLVVKADWSEDGTVVSGGSNLFQLAYSVNGGGAWTTFLSHANVTSASSGTASATLTTSDPTQVQVRDLLRAAGTVGGDSASVTATVSNVRLEVTTQDAQLLAMM